MNDSELRLECLRSPEIRRLIDDGWSTVVFACGAVEQHGPHLPLFVDAEHGTALAVRVARRIGKTLVAPTVRIGCSDHHMAFAGTISFRRDTFEAVVTDYVRSLAHHGFRKIAILPTHGGNFEPLDQMQTTLQNVAQPARVAVYTELVELLSVWRKIVQQQTAHGERVGGHADIAETAIMMYLHGHLVRDDLAEPGYLGEFDRDAITKMIAEGFDTVTPNGILGDARGANAALGEQLIDGVADVIAQKLDWNVSNE